MIRTVRVGPFLRRGLAAVVAAFALLPVLLPAQERITLDDAVARALVRSPTMAQQEQGVLTARTGQRQAWGSFLPTLSVSSSGALRSQNRFDPNTDRVVQGSSDSYSAGISASYSVFEGGRRFAELDAADAEIVAAEASREDQRFQVTLDTEIIFFEALRQSDLLEVERTRLEQAEQNLSMVRRRTEVGRATISDSLRARLERVNAEQAVLQAETATRAARFQLGRQIGEGMPVVPVPPESLEPGPLPLAEAEIMQIAEAASPGVVAARAQAGAASAQVSAARTAYLPNLSLSSGYNWANQSASFADGTTSWSLALRASYPIFNGFQRGTTVERARFAQQVANLQEEDARLGARAEADAALQDIRTAERGIEIAEEALLVASEDLRVVRERYEVGVATVLDVIISQAAADEAAASAVTARYDYWLARARLEAVLGREL